MKASTPFFLVALLLSHVHLCMGTLESRQSCSSDYALCSPQGASIRDIPPIGPGLARLYLNLIETVNPQPAQTNGSSTAASAHEARQGVATLCCASNTLCILVLSYNIPCCWDHFTTNYYFVDGSYGSVTTGNYTTPAGDHANLITGEYELANGQMGNIYQGDTGAEPNTSSLALPTPFTSTGVGSAIPASAVGSPLTITSYTSSMLALTPPSATSGLSSSDVSSSMVNVTTSMESAPVGTESSQSSVTTVSPTQSQITPPMRNDAAAAPFCGRLVLQTIIFIAAGMHVWPL
ncbi:hypothetical protein EDD37DRAFT_74389 [Exophiala viscosa]|uniref:uncharacterized protein n=1 Tax=Exophiala viscosa TaxID=2486360 RepID=UPI00218EE240|nr:hypothetical protein EDD37DRAFT_74389 [Exophiala viscosa]